MSLDPQVQNHYQGKKHKNLIGIVPIEKLRAAVDLTYNDQTVLVPLPFVENASIPADTHTIPVRIYRPTGEASEKEKLPVILYFHGGAFVFHNIASHDNLCRKLALEAHALVVNVEYRLAPEHRYPAAIHDAYQALNWIHKEACCYGGDENRIFAAGDSAGANLSAALAFYTRDHKGPALAGQILYYGTYGCISYDESESVKLFANGDYVLPRDMMEAASSLYRDTDTKEDDPYYNPGQAKNMRIPGKTLIVTAEYDPLRDDGQAFSQKMKKAGNQVTLYRMPGMMHGFMLLWDQFDATKIIFQLTKEFIG